MTYKRALAVCMALAACPLPAAAMVSADQTDMRQYVHARLADAAGLPDAAAASYARLMAASPDDRRLAMRTYRQAMTAGNMPLALQAARQLDRLGDLPADGSLLMLSDAVMTRDWARARALCDRVEKEELFGFIAPVARAWIAVGDGRGDPLRILDAPGKSPFAGGYIRDHRILIELVTGPRDKGLAELRTLIGQRDSRALRLRLAAAALLSKRGDIATALPLLDGREPELAAARERLESARTLPGAIETAAGGLSELLTQVAIDVKGAGASPVSLQLARLAVYLAPDNAAATIGTADLMASAGYKDAALALLAAVPVDNPLAEAARQVRTEILVDKGETRTALVEAEKVAGRKGADASDLVELGNILSELDRPAEAAQAFQRAIDLDTAEGKPSWAHLFLKAGALDRAGQWQAAKVALHEANKVDPARAIVLNYLGYGMLEHGDDLAEAQVYIERASAIDPSDAAISDSLGWLYYKRGNFPGAVAALERAIAADPGEGVMHEHLGDVYWSSGRRIEARYAWRAALIHADKASTDRLQRKLSDGLVTGQ